MGNLGPTELILILVAVVLFFGAKKIPELAQGLGKGIREFKKATNDIAETAAEVKKTGSDPTGIKEIKDTIQGLNKKLKDSITT